MFSAEGSNCSRSLRWRQSLWSRLLNLPNILIAVWAMILLWGERWVFYRSIKTCEWNTWERWPREATPHHLVLLADPQLIDPHTYPGRGWPLSSLTMFHTDYYLRRSYTQLMRILHPDSLVFLGDLFDGGREWKTARGNAEDPSWAQGLRPSGERAYVETWGKRYGEDFWLQEYERFGDIFHELWNLNGDQASKGNRGRRLISTLPGNHDLGFGAQIKIPVRNRFETYFGSGNRVDVIGNHTFVSVDSVSLSAGSSDRPKEETAPISRSVEHFLSTVQATKRRAVVRELGFLAGEEKVVHHRHRIEDLKKADFSNFSTLDPGPSGPDLPTVVLTHVPLYRKAGTPCGPQRERFPPSRPPKGQYTPVIPDERNAIKVVGGYQYQNTLGEEDSINLISSIGNVEYVFSGDDHDYCELVHPADKNHAREITVKSISYAMGIRKPGFLMLSMWNPIDENGRSNLRSQATGHDATLSSNVQHQTIETHLCLLPDQLGILINYGAFALLTLLVLLVRALYSTDASKIEPSLLPSSNTDLLPKFTSLSNPKEKADPPEKCSHQHDYTDSNSSTSSTSLTALAPRTGKTIAGTRGRSLHPSEGYGLPAGLGTGTAPVIWAEDQGEVKETRKAFRVVVMKKGQKGLIRWSMARTFARDVFKVAGVVMAVFMWFALTG